MRTAARHSAQNTQWLPVSRAGAWSVGLGLLAVAGTAGTIVAFALGVERADGFTDTDHWAISLAGVGVLVSAAAALVTGVSALVRRDRAWLVVAAVVVGGLITLLMLQQVAEGLGWLSS